MLRKITPSYPGKPGPKPTGLKRGKQFPLMLSSDEELYLKLAAHHSKRGMKPSPYIRKRAFPHDWQIRLADLIEKYPELANG